MMKSSLRPTIVVGGDEDQDRFKCSVGLRSKALMFSALVQQSLHWLPHDASSSVSSKLITEIIAPLRDIISFLRVMIHDDVSVGPYQVASKNKCEEQVW